MLSGVEIFNFFVSDHLKFRIHKRLCKPKRATFLSLYSKEINIMFYEKLKLSVNTVLKVSQLECF